MQASNKETQRPKSAYLNKSRQNHTQTSIRIKKGTPKIAANLGSSMGKVMINNEQSLTINPQNQYQLHQRQKWMWILIQKPQYQQQLIGPLDLTFIFTIILEIISKINLLEKKKIFYPDLLTLTPTNIKTTCQKINLKAIEHLNIPKTTRDLMLHAKQIDYKQILSSFERKHVAILNMYRIEEQNYIYQEFIKDSKQTKKSIENLDQDKLPQGLFIQKIENILEKFSINQNRRYLLYAISHFLTLILQNPQLPNSNIFVKNSNFLFKSFLQLLQQQNPRSLEDIEKVFKQLQSNSKTQCFAQKTECFAQKSQFFTQNTHILISHSERNVIEPKDFLVNGQNSSIIDNENNSRFMNRLVQFHNENLGSPYKRYKGGLERANNLRETDQNYNWDHNLRTSIGLNIIKYLSKNPTNFIAKYYDVQLQMDSNGYIKSFEYKMERGDQDFIDKSNQKITPNFLLDIGKKAVINFIICSSLSISEMQKKGIFQADLEVHNFIKLNNIFEAIDFNHALLCKIPNRKQFQNIKKLTLQAIQRWLQNKQNTLRKIFEDSQFKPFLQIKRNFQQTRLESSIHYCFQHLSLLMKFGHKQQFKAILDSILKNKKSLQVFKKQQIEEINQLIKTYIDIDDPNYVMFAAGINLSFGQSSQILGENQNLNMQEMILLCGKHVQLWSKYVDKKQSYSHQQRIQKLKNSIQIYKFLSEKQLTFISKPIFHEYFIIYDRTNQQTDYKIVHMDDSLEIVNYSDILIEGKKFIYEVIYKIIKVMEELNSLKIHHKLLIISCFVKKSKTIYLRNMINTQLLQKNQNSQIQQVFAVQYYKKLGQLMACHSYAQMLAKNSNITKDLAFQPFPLPNVFPQQRQVSKQEQMRISHFNQVKKLIKEIIENANNQGLQQGEKNQIEVILNKNTIDGLKELKQHVKAKKQYQQLTSSVRNQTGIK